MADDPQNPQPAPGIKIRRGGSYHKNLSSSITVIVPPAGNSIPFSNALAYFMVNGEDLPNGYTSATHGNPKTDIGFKETANTDSTGGASITVSGSASVTSRTVINLPAGSTARATANSGSYLDVDYNAATSNASVMAILTPL
jgi:hypothetical protein